MKRGRILLIAGAGLLLVAATAFVAATLAVKALEAQVEESIGRTLDFSDARVSLRTGSVALLRGHVRQVEIQGRDGRVRGLSVDSVNLTLTGVEFDPVESLLQNRAVITRIRAARLRARISLPAIQLFINENAPELQGWNIRLRVGKVVAERQFPLLGLISIIFRPVVADGHMRLIPEEISGAKIAGEQLAASWAGGLTIPIEDLPLDTVLTRVEVAPSFVELEASRPRRR